MINFSFCHLILLLELVGVYTLEKRLKELLAFSHLKRRGRNIKREREREGGPARPFFFLSLLSQWGRSTELSIVFAFLSRRNRPRKSHDFDS